MTSVLAIWYAKLNTNTYDMSCGWNFCQIKFANFTHHLIYRRYIYSWHLLGKDKEFWSFKVVKIFMELLIEKCFQVGSPDKALNLGVVEAVLPLCTYGSRSFVALLNQMESWQNSIQYFGKLVNQKWAWLTEFYWILINFLKLKLIKKGAMILK